MPLFVSLFWLFIYRWRQFNVLSDLSKSHKSISKKFKKKKKIKFFWRWGDYDEYMEEIYKKYGTTNKIDLVMMGVFIFYFIYYTFYANS